MSKTVIGQVVGGSKKALEGETVQDVANQLGAASGYTATRNNQPADFNEELRDGDILIFAKAAKGG